MMDVLRQLASLTFAPIPTLLSGRNQVLFEELAESKQNYEWISELHDKVTRPGGNLHRRNSLVGVHKTARLDTF